MKRGLTLGKFAPLHSGHQFVIESALAQMDEVIVLIYDAAESTPIPLEVRSQWIRNLYPKCKVIEVMDGPREVGYTTAIMRAQEECILRVLSGTKITHFYSSEPYGEHVSQALGACNRTIDIARRQFPVSASAIRNDPFAYRHFVELEVYRTLVTHVVLIGAPSTGKSTLAQHLATHFDTCFTPEHGRDYWHANQVNRRLSLAQLNALAHQHIEKEDLQLAQSNRYLFTDTNALTTAVFSEYYHGVVHPDLERLVQLSRRRYDLVLLCGDDIPYDDSEDRSGEDNRRLLQRATENKLHNLDIPYQRIDGALGVRASQVKDVLAKYNKWPSRYASS